MDVKIIFLDIDGVLNSRASIVALGESWPEEDMNLLNFNQVSVGMLRYLCNQEKFSIYVHSTWANKMSDEYFERMLKHFNINADLLPSVQKDYRIREMRIKEALQHYMPEDYIIIDDDHEIQKKFKDNYILINASDGFSFHDLCRALQHFGKNEPLIFI